MESKLEDLLVEETEIKDENRLYDILNPYISIRKKDGAFIFQEKYFQLSEKMKIVVVLLGRKVGKMLLGSKESVPPKEIVKESGINYNTAKMHLSNMYKTGLLAKDKIGYYVPGYNINKISSLLQDGEKKPKVKQKVRKRREKPTEKEDEKLNKILKTEKDILTPYNYIYKVNKSHEKAYVILKMANEEFGVKSLTPPQISQILIHRFKIPLDGNLINVALGHKVGKEVGRIPEGKTYGYHLLKPGEDYLEKRIKEIRKDTSIGR